MGFRLLIDENVETEVAVFLRNRGHHAEHVQEGIGKGTEDLDLAGYARQNNLAVVTYDDDFLYPENNLEISVFYVSDKRTPPKDIVTGIDQLTEWGVTQDDLARVTRIPP